MERGVVDAPRTNVSRERARAVHHRVLERACVGDEVTTAHLKAAVDNRTFDVHAGCLQNKWLQEHITLMRGAIEAQLSGVFT